MKMNLFKEHQYLLMRRESRVVLGHRAINLWLLVLVLTATFFAIAFSAGSTNYLDDKMNDPFTNWVNIDLSGADDNMIKSLKDSLSKDSVRRNFGFDGVQTEINSSLNMVAVNGRWRLLSTLFYENLSSDLIAAVLSEENVIDRHSIAPDSISESSMGVILTLDALLFLGYDRDSLPAYVDYHSKSIGADTLGIEMLSDNVYARAPLPLLAVVKRLPMNKEAVSSKYLNEVRIKAGSDCPIDMNHENYANELFFFVPAEVKGFSKESLRSCLPDTLKSCVDDVLPQQERVQNQLRCWQNGMVWRVYTIPGTPNGTIKAVEGSVLAQYRKQGVERVYFYNEMAALSGNAPRDNVISAHFDHLDSISPFEHYVKNVSGLQIEMTQVNSKRNFWAVSDMANILTVAMIVFAIICIIIFITNMLQNYFQKVRRNLGTFKAFGMSTSELTRVYVVIIVAIVIIALAVALTATWLTELLLPVMGVMKDGEYSYLTLWNIRTLWAVVIIAIATVLTVLLVMRRLLRQTPGDLIYDR